MKKPLITIGIPVYNCEKYVYGAVNSALVQTYKNVEVIVVDDASTDETRNICRSFGNKIKYIRNEKNMGIGYGRWKIVKEAKGDFVVFCSADDIISNQFVEEMLKLARDYPERILYSDFFVIDELGHVNNRFEAFETEEDDDFRVCCMESAMRQTMFVNLSSVMIPKDVFSEVNFNKNIRFGEDLDFVLRAMKQFNFKHVPLTLTKYRRHNDMVTMKKWNEIDENNKKIFNSWLDYWRK